MTEHRSFKRLVRARMDKTGESYTAARAVLLRDVESDATNGVRLATSDEQIRRRTGRGWEEWFEMLDAWGAAERTHRDIARWVAGQQGVEPLAWNAQAIAGSYELARGLRAVGEKEDGFAITASKTTLNISTTEPAATGTISEGGARPTMDQNHRQRVLMTRAVVAGVLPPRSRRGSRCWSSLRRRPVSRPRSSAATSR